MKLQTFPHLYKGALDCLKQNVKADGIPGLYRGSVPACACSVSENAVLFVALGMTRKFVGYITNNDPDRLT